MPLRFKIGDKVECRTGEGWQKGEVVALWDEENPYRVALWDEENPYRVALD